MPAYHNDFFNLELCPLCLQSDFPCVENSHLFPRFLRKLHNRSTTRFALGLTSDYSHQDLPKFPLLCTKCDNVRLGTALERPLSVALKKDGYRSRGSQSDMLVARAWASVLWRNAFVLRNFVQSPKNIKRTGAVLHDCLDELKSAVDQAYYLFHFESALEEWRRFVLDGTPIETYPIFAVHDAHLEKVMQSHPDTVHPKTGARLRAADNILFCAGMRQVGPNTFLFTVIIQRLALVGVVGSYIPTPKEIEKVAKRHLLVLHKQAYAHG